MHPPLSPRIYKGPNFNLFKYMENQEQNNISEPIILEANENNTSNDNGISANEKERRKRRSKNDPSGRQHKCDICGKTYLSRPALSQHIKTKHEDRLGEYKRGRGRPRKCETDLNANLTLNKFNEFYSRSICLKNNEESYDYKELIQQAVTELLEKFPEVLNPSKIEIKDHPLLSTEIKTSETESKNVFYDESIIRYLQEASTKVNKEYFLFMVKFCFLFRESFNIIKKAEFPTLEKEFSTSNPAEEVPDKCNDFISGLMENNNYFELDSNEVIEIIQHFCRWLYEKNFTTSVLSLV